MQFISPVAHCLRPVNFQEIVIYYIIIVIVTSTHTCVLYLTQACYRNEVYLLASLVPYGVH